MVLKMMMMMVVSAGRAKAVNLWTPDPRVVCCKERARKHARAHGRCARRAWVTYRQNANQDEKEGCVCETCVCTRQSGGGDLRRGESIHQALVEKGGGGRTTRSKKEICSAAVLARPPPPANKGMWAEV